MKAETDLLESITTMRNVVAKLVSPEAASIAQSGPELQQLLVGKRLLINHFQTPAEYAMVAEIDAALHAYEGALWRST
jgi:hypothetical protein